MKRLHVLFAAMFALPACATVPAEAGGLGSISYETGPCFGACPVYQVTVNADGTGTFDGRRFTTVTGRRTFTVTSAQWRAFSTHLAPHRPDGEEVIGPGHARCRMQATDHPSATVTWNDGPGGDRLAFYFGCHDAENETLARALEAAPTLLPIREYIGR